MREASITAYACNRAERHAGPQPSLDRGRSCNRLLHCVRIASCRAAYEKLAMTQQSESALLRRADGLRLMRAFLRVRDREQRRAVIDVVEQLALQSERTSQPSSFVERQDP